MSASLEALHLEANITTYSNRLILKAQEKALRRTDDHPKRVDLTTDIPHCLQDRCSFCHKAKNLSTLLPAEPEHHQTINHSPSPPWQLSTPCKEQISTSVPGTAGQADDIDLKCQFNLTLIASYQVDYTIYTDVSASGGTRNGGAAAAVTRGSSIQPEVANTIKTKGRTFTSSYEEEAGAMESALNWTSANANHPSITILFCTDSKSLCEALISSNPRASSVHNSIHSISSSIFIQWITGHSAIVGNKLADKAAKEATPIATNAILPVSFSSSMQVINETICDDPPSHERTAQVYQHQKVSRDS